MIKIVLPPAAGKTARAIQIANETGAYLVVRSRAQVEAVKDRTNRFPVTFAELRQDGMRSSFVRNIVIDDADAFIAHQLPHLKIDAITMDGNMIPPLLGADRIDALLHILRNPYGHSAEEKRKARLEAADLIEAMSIRRRE